MSPEEREVVASRIAEKLGEAFAQDPRCLGKLLGSSELCHSRLEASGVLPVSHDEDGVRSLSVWGLIEGLVGVREDGTSPFVVDRSPEGTILGVKHRSAPCC